MRIEITEFEKTYGFQIETVAQLCGQNLRKKSYIFESLRRYFGGYKYSEEKNKWRDNVFIDGREKGRKYYIVLSIAKKEDIISYINISKKSILLEFIKNKIIDFDCQKNLELIQEQVEFIFGGLNQEIEQLGNITLDFKNEDLWNMVQSSYSCGKYGIKLEDMEEGELLEILFNLVEKIQKSMPQRYMILIENIDHMVSPSQYYALYDKMNQIAMQNENLFIVSLSLMKYPVLTKENLESIVVFNEVDFELPDYEHLKDFLENNYPYYREFSQEQILNICSNVIHRIGCGSYLMGVEENVICKMINQSLMLPESVEFIGTLEEKAFLQS